MTNPTHPRALRVERATLAVLGCVAGAYAILALLIPQRVATALFGHALPPGGILLHELLGGTQLGLALVALVAARAPKPPRTIVRAIALGLFCAVVGVSFSTMVRAVPVPELRSFAPVVGFYGVVTILLALTQLARRR
jgi:peptidoglycan/LPS O-acetylase OafA/YrhL